MVIGLTCAWLTVSTLAAVAAAEDARALIKNRAEACGNAMQAGEYDKVAELTHPKVLEALGGKKKAAETMRSVIDDMEIQGISIESYTIGEISEIVSEKDNQFAIVHTVMKMKAPKGRLSQNSFLIAVSPDKGKSWTFVDGNAIDALKQSGFPLPSGLKLPAVEEPVLTPDKKAAPATPKE